MSDSDPIATFSYLAKQLDLLGLGYLHVPEPIAGPGAVPSCVPTALSVMRGIFGGTFVANGGYNEASGRAAVAEGKADPVAFGAPFIANPDLPMRYLKRAPLNSPDPSGFYSGEEKGYIDYPTLKPGSLASQ